MPLKGPQKFNIERSSYASLIFKVLSIDCRSMLYLFSRIEKTERLGRWDGARCEHEPC